MYALRTGVYVDGNLSLPRAVGLTVQLIRLDSSTYLSGTIHVIYY